MKSIEQIKEEYVKELDNGSFTSWSDYRNYNSIHEEDLEIIARRYAEEYAREALRLASENFLGASDFAVDTREAILHESNLPSHS